MTVPNTGSSQAWQTITKTGVTLSQGQQLMRVSLDTTGSSGDTGNINYINFVLRAASDTTPPAKPGGFKIRVR